MRSETVQRFDETDSVKIALSAISIATSTNNLRHERLNQYIFFLEIVSFLGATLCQEEIYRTNNYFYNISSDKYFSNTCTGSRSASGGTKGARASGADRGEASNEVK